MQNTWPTKAEIEDFGDNWNQLPLIKCYDVPDFLDPSVMYTDKSHSLARSEFVAHLKSSPRTPIPTRRVLETALKEQPT